MCANLRCKSIDLMIARIHLLVSDQKNATTSSLFNNWNVLFSSRSSDDRSFAASFTFISRSLNASSKPIIYVKKKNHKHENNNNENSNFTFYTNVLYPPLVERQTRADFWNVQFWWTCWSFAGTQQTEVLQTISISRELFIEKNIVHEKNRFFEQTSNSLGTEKRRISITKLNSDFFAVRMDFSSYVCAIYTLPTASLFINERLKMKTNGVCVNSASFSVNRRSFMLRNILWLRLTSWTHACDSHAIVVPRQFFFVHSSLCDIWYCTHCCLNEKCLTLFSSFNLVPFCPFMRKRK